MRVAGLSGLVVGEQWTYAKDLRCSNALKRMGWLESDECNGSQLIKCRSCHQLLHSRCILMTSLNMSVRI